MSKIRIAVVDDHKIIRDGIVSLFDGHPEIEIVADFDNGMEFLHSIQHENYHLVLLDMNMPKISGIEVAREIKAKHPSLKILIHTMSEVASEIEQIVKLGADGYILKSAGQQEMTLAIKMIIHGGTYYNSTVMSSFIQSCLGNDNPVNQLSSDEIGILKMYCEENPLYKIALKYHLTEQEVKEKIVRIKERLRISSEIGLGKFYASHEKELSAFMS
ncbi:MAG: response regulator transcription factor [Chitinophagales bacterium]|nr:response regulator transcription factor [Chitinophagales bacterium]